MIASAHPDQPLARHVSAVLATTRQQLSMVPDTTEPEQRDEIDNLFYTEDGGEG